MIDTESAPGSWAEAIAHSPCLRVVSDTQDWLDRRLALRKAARLERNPHKRGHITRRINTEAVR